LKPKGLDVFIKILLPLGFMYAVLYFAWYQYQSSGSFHFFDDRTEWLGMDKLGHFITAFVESWIAIEVYKSFLKSKGELSIINYQLSIVGMAGFLFQLPIEIMDGFSAGYGFSIWDCMANFLGCVSVTVQYLIWKRVEILPKVSFFPSSYAAIRPELLGFTFIEQCIKDYNGQTYWISFNPNLFTRGLKLFPSWLNIAVGYSVDGLWGGHDNIWTDQNGNTQDYSNVKRTFLFYLSLDIDVQKLPIKNKYIRWTLGIFNVLKVPIPGIAF
jgi:hypothetical protein